MNRTYNSGRRSIILIAFAVLITGCSDKDDGLNRETITIPADASSVLLEVKSTADGKTIPVYFAAPSTRSKSKAIVVLHGSGGLWKDEDTDQDGVADKCEVGILERQFREWEKLLLDAGYAVAFPDSYSSRGTCENEGAYKVPPLKFAISGTFIRNHDALNVLELLEKLVWEDSKEPVIDIENVGVIGFSDGGTAVLSSVYNETSAPENWEWKQSFNGVTYTTPILPPVNTQARKFKTAVAYYPGSYHNGYYGDLCGSTGIYQSYCDVLFHLPEEDPLSKNSECLIATMTEKGGGGVHVERYGNAKHGFDANDEPVNTAARSNTISFLNQQLRSF